MSIFPDPKGDPSPAIFLNKDTARLMAKRTWKTPSTPEMTSVRPFKRRGEMLGYVVSVVFRGETRLRTMTEGDFERLAGA